MNGQIDKQVHKDRGIDVLAKNSLFVAFAFASLETIWPLFLFTFFGSDVAVGYVTAFLAILGVVGLATLYPLFHKYHARDLYYISLSIQALLFIIYTQLTNKYVFLGLAVISVFFASIRIQAFGILIRENTSQKNITKTWGLMYFLANIGWVLAPLIGGFIATTFGMRVVLVFSSLCLLLSIFNLTVSPRLREANVHEKPKPFYTNVGAYFKSSKRIGSYILSGGLEAWYTLPYIFIPLYLQSIHIGFDVIGVFLAIFSVPLVIMQYWIKGQTKIPARVLMRWGYGIVTIVTFASLLFEDIYVKLAWFVLGAFGTGLLEPTTESYFFNITSLKEERDFYGTFMTSKIIGGFSGRILIATILIFAPLTLGIAAIGVLMAGHFIVAMTTKKSHRTTQTALHQYASKKKRT